jgi:hemerythrin-like domain-containing protein
MSNPPQGVAADMLRIHRAITRGLQVTLERSEAFNQAGFPDKQTQLGFSCYVRSFANLLHSHHLTEEELAFPYFAVKIPDEPYDTFLFEHSEMAGFVYEIRSLTGLKEEALLPNKALEAINCAATGICGIWYSHIIKEEKIFDPERINKLIDTPEQIKMGRMFAEHNQKHTAPDYLSVPFLLYNLQHEDRQMISQLLPSEVTQQLVPVVWKEKWAPMKPFLLE